MCAASETDMVKTRFRHVWHMRWSQGSLAERWSGISSSPHVRQETILGGAGALLPKKPPNILDVFRLVVVWAAEGFALIVAGVVARLLAVGLICRSRNGDLERGSGASEACESSSSVSLRSTLGSSGAVRLRSGM